MKLQWISKNVSDGMPKTVPAHIHTYIGLLVKMKKKCENFCILNIFKKIQKQSMQGQGVHLLYIFVLPACCGNYAFAYIKQV